VSRDREKGIITVAMEDPADNETIGDLEKIFKAKIEPAVSTLAISEYLLNDMLDVWILAR